MAKKQAAKTVYEVTVSGHYFGGENGQNLLKPYRVTLNMGQEHIEAGTLSVFKNQFAPKAMPAQYPDYTGLATHYLDSCINKADPEQVPTDPALMNLGQLTALIEQNEMPVTIGLYADESELRQAIVECIEDEDAFRKQQDKRQELRGKSVELANSLNELNPGLVSGLSASAAAVAAKDVNPEKVPDISEVKLPAKPKAGSQTDLEDDDEL
jgi:hypothetical protein